MIQPPVTDELISGIHIDPENARKLYELDTLLPSIQQNGILQPIGLVADAERDCRFVLWGNRRFLCSQKLGLETIPARVFTGPISGRDKAKLQLIENLQRIDLRPSEEANAYRSLIDGGMKARDIAEMLSLSDAKVSRKLSLLKLAAPLLALVDENQLSQAAAWELSHLDEAAQLDIIRQFGTGLGRGEMADVVRKTRHGETSSRPKPSRLAFKLGGVSVSFTGKADTLNYDTLLSVLGRISKEARSLKEGGQTDLSLIARSLRPS
jgi:ParB/RepB/Spo0J family partition protein